MAENIVEQGVNSFKRIPPIGLAVVVIAGVGGVLYIRSRKPAADSSSTPVDPDGLEGYQAIAIERGPVGALPPSSSSNADESAPRRDNEKAIKENGVVAQGGGAPPTISKPEPYANVPNPVPAEVTPAPVPVTPVAPVPVAPVVPPVQIFNPEPKPSIVYHYPGLPDNFILKASDVRFREILHKPWEQVVADQKKKGQNTTVNARQLSQIAIGGFPKDEVIKGYELGNEGNRAWINKQRIWSGLHPLNSDQFNTLQSVATSLWDGNEHASIFQSYEYAHRLFDRFNKPFQSNL